MVDESALLVHQRERHGEPLNAETKGEALIEEVQTSTERLFHRNHGDIVKVPQESDVVEEEWKVAFDVGDDVWTHSEEPVVREWMHTASPTPRSITLGDLKTEIEEKSISVAMECAGNRREDLNDKAKTEGIPWQAGAISNASWQGVALPSLLLHLGVPDPYSHHENGRLNCLSLKDECMRSDCGAWARFLHLHLLSAQSIPDVDEKAARDGVYFAASIPLYTAMHPRQDCLLAIHQNGQVLTQAHGFPLRAVIPGHIGARWVKWLRGLRVSSKADDGPSMKMDYKIIRPPDEMSEEGRKDWLRSMTGDTIDQESRSDALSRASPLQTMGIGSAIRKPELGEVLSGSTVTVEGYAVGQHGEAIAQVELAVVPQELKDLSLTKLRSRAAEIPSEEWTKARLRRSENSEGNATWSWSLWSAELQLPAIGSGQQFAIVARAGEFYGT